MTLQGEGFSMVRKGIKAEDESVFNKGIDLLDKLKVPFGLVILFVLAAAAANA